MEACAHPRQAERLATLRRYDILDTPREQEFDDVVDLVAELCDVPIAVVNLIDEHRQWFKAEIGLGTRETPLETSICSHVILESDFVEIEDTLKDPRTADNELCLAPEGGLRFYAGALLKADNGLPIGTLCVLDTKPNKLSETQRKTVSILARQLMRELDLRLALRGHEKLRNEMDHRVQNSLQTIASNLRLQKRRAEQSGDWSSALDAVRQQIEAVGAIHRELHISDVTGMLDLSGYMDTLGQHLRDALPVELTLNVDVPSLMIRPEMASALGMIVNEFVNNAVKHAFGENYHGTVDIVIEDHGDNLQIICENDKGGEIEPHFETGTGLGRKIISAAVAQQGGMLDEGPIANGYRLAATFPMPSSQ